MKALINLIVGLVVSLIGSLPLGYINIVAFEVFRLQGLSGLLSFLTGITIVEFVLILFILKGLQWLLEQRKLVQLTELLSIGFMIFLAFTFYNRQIISIGETADSENFIARYPPVMLGLILSAVNLVQVPFWAGWNVYLVNASVVHIEGNRKYAYLAGTSIGTFGGILLFVILFSSLLKFTNLSPATDYILPTIFVGLATFQSVKFYHKYQLPG